MALAIEGQQAAEVSETAAATTAAGESVVQAMSSLGGSGGRFVCLLTRNRSALKVLERNNLLGTATDNVRVLFGSAFRDDASYARVCSMLRTLRNAMARGDTVVLLQLDILYESLYDLLNMLVIRTGDTSWINLSIGALSPARVECRLQHAISHHIDHSQATCRHAASCIPTSS